MTLRINLKILKKFAKKEQQVSKEKESNQTKIGKKI